MKLLNCAAWALVIASSLSASVAGAAPITRSYHVVASNFTNSAATAGLASWVADFTVTFDPLVNYVGAPLDAYTSAQLNSGGYGPYVFSFFASNGSMQVGDNCPSSCTLSTTDAIITLNLTDPDAPVFSSAIYRNIPVGNNPTDFRAASGTVSLATDSSPIPEPATLALFGAGLFGLGLARCRRRG